jgi:hypothetical protein
MQKFLVFSVFALAAAVAADHPALGGTLVLDPAHSLTGGPKSSRKRWLSTSSQSR